MSYNGLPVLVRGGFGLLVPSDRAVICSAKPLRSYLLADYIRRYIKNLIIIIIIIMYSYTSEQFELFHKQLPVVHHPDRLPPKRWIFKKQVAFYCNLRWLFGWGVLIVCFISPTAQDLAVDDCREDGIGQFKFKHLISLKLRQIYLKWISSNILAHFTNDKNNLYLNSPGKPLLLADLCQLPLSKFNSGVVINEITCTFIQFALMWNYGNAADKNLLAAVACKVSWIAFYHKCKMSQYITQNWFHSDLSPFERVMRCLDLNLVHKYISLGEMTR